MDSRALRVALALLGPGVHEANYVRFGVFGVCFGTKLVLFMRLRVDTNTIANEPVFVRQSDGGCFVERYGRYEAAEGPRFVKYERKPWRKRLLDTATLETIEIPLFS